MLSISLTAPRTLERIEVQPPPAPGPGEVLLKVTTVGVCGSDVHYYTQGRIGSQVVKYPFRVGHEFAAIVVQTGKGVTNLLPGQRVAVDPAIACERCDQCLMGREHTCRHLRFLGCPGQAEGCLCERIVMPASRCFPVPDTLDDAMTALVEPLSIGCYAVSLAGAVKGSRIAILGCGPIGLSVLVAVRNAGAERIFATDPIAHRRELASELGADWTGHPDDDDPVETINKLEPNALSAVFECCGRQSALDQAVELLSPGGRLLLVGIPEVDRVSFSIDTLRRRELVIQNVRRQNNCMREAILLAEQQSDLLRRMLTHSFRPDESRQAFETVAAYRDGIVKAMIRFDGD